MHILVSILTYFDHLYLSKKLQNICFSQILKYGSVTKNAGCYSFSKYSHVIDKKCCAKGVLKKVANYSFCIWT